MPAPVSNFIPNGPGWPTHGRRSGMGDWIPPQAIPQAHSGLFDPSLEYKDVAPGLIDPPFPVNWQYEAGQIPGANPSALPEPQLSGYRRRGGLADWMELKGFTGAARLLEKPLVKWGLAALAIYGAVKYFGGKKRKGKRK